MASFKRLTSTSYDMSSLLLATEPDAGYKVVQFTEFPRGNSPRSVQYNISFIFVDLEVNRLRQVVQKKLDVRSALSGHTNGLFNVCTENMALAGL
jgi:hypothetical protein